MEFRSALLISTLALGVSTAFGNINNSGLQVSIYVGATETAISPGDLQFSGENDSLIPNHLNVWGVSWGLGLAYRFVQPSCAPYNLLHDITLGLDYFYLQGQQNGQVWQFENPSMYNFNYTLPLHSSRLLVDSEWTFHPIGTRTFPFIEGGMGFTANRTNYYDAPVPGLTGTSTIINKNTKYQFTYTVGGGFKFLIIPSLEASLRYLFSDLGHGTTATTGSTTLVAPVRTALTTQSILFGLTYLF